MKRFHNRENPQWDSLDVLLQKEFMGPECLGSPRLGMFQKFRVFSYSLSRQISTVLTATQFRQWDPRWKTDEWVANMQQIPGRGGWGKTPGECR